MTRQYTANMFGTMGYAAPEALGYFEEDDATITYTMSVDIWAVGTIALTLLLGREVFPRQGDLSRYVNGQRALDFARAEGDELSNSCRDFVTQLLAPHPVVRPTAIAALAHPWLKQASPPLPPPDADIEMHGTQTSQRVSASPPATRHIKEETPFRQQLRYSPYPRKQTKTNTKPIIKLETKDAAKLQLYPTRDLASIERINHFLSLDSILLTPKLRTLVSPEVHIYLNNQWQTALFMFSVSHNLSQFTPPLIFRAICPTEPILCPSLRQCHRYRNKRCPRCMDFQPARQQDPQQGLCSVRGTRGDAVLRHHEVRFPPTVCNPGMNGLMRGWLVGANSSPHFGARGIQP